MSKGYQGLKRIGKGMKSGISTVIDMSLYLGFRLLGVPEHIQKSTEEYEKYLNGDYNDRDS